MHFPRFMRHVNRNFTNPLLGTVAWLLPPFAIVHHVGRKSGKAYKAPVVAFPTKKGFVIPMTYARIDDEIFLHGAVASRWLSKFDQGAPVSVCVTHLDGLVLAQSAFSHSMNYRSVVCFGEAKTVTDVDRKQEIFKAFVDHLIPGRWDDTRQPDRKESEATVVLSVPIDEASIKARTGPPADAAKDLDEGHWTGVIPLEIANGPPIPSPDTGDHDPVPGYVTDFDPKRR